MSFIITRVLSNGIVMAADSACALVNPADRRKDQTFTHSSEKLWIMKNNIGIASGNEIVTSDGRPIDLDLPRINFSSCRP
jgi:hypothetical protein